MKPKYKLMAFTLFLLLLLSTFMLYDHERSKKDKLFIECVNESSERTLPTTTSENGYTSQLCCGLLKVPERWETNCSEVVEISGRYPLWPGFPDKKPNWTSLRGVNVAFYNGGALISIANTEFWGSRPHHFTLMGCAYENGTLFLRVEYEDCPTYNRMYNATETCLMDKWAPTFFVHPKVKLENLVIYITGGREGILIVPWENKSNGI
ncbi:hypothetical protein [Thermococcus sp.]|uniref:hypothetical protein n=1 Tax=Thermococcus sp. TaxID=35749 RepID=UPI0025FFAC34|nr:hypothetical protein [Thermococcus sp.]